MSIVKIPAAFYRGGSSKAVIFHDRDLPEDRSQRHAVFLHVLGSPDPYQRQLNGLGGGLSSLSKVVVVAPSDLDGVDVDYTFVQIAVDEAIVDYGSMCGNMSSSVGPFAVDEGLVTVSDGPVTVRIRNTNTNKIFHAHFDVKDGLAVEEGDFVIPGVTGSGAKITLNYLDPGGAVTSHLLPSGQPTDKVDVPGLGQIDVSLVDASNPVVFVNAHTLGLSATEQPEQLEADRTLMDRLDIIRRAGGVVMGMATNAKAIGLSNPKVAVVGRSANFTAIDKRAYDADTHDVSIRIISMQRVHKAITLTGALCAATAAQITGSIVHDLARPGEPLNIGNPSGILPVSALLENDASGLFEAISATSYRTQRRLMEGAVRVPAKIIEDVG